MKVAHFDLTGKTAVVTSADRPAGAAAVVALTEAGARVTSVPSGLPPAAVGTAVTTAAATGLDVLVTADDQFYAHAIGETDQAALTATMDANFGAPFAAAQAAVAAMRAHGNAGRIVHLTHALGERGLPNTSAYSAAHGALFNFIRALAQEVAPDGISINGIAMGWMDWMQDRIDPSDPDAQRAVRFTISKRAGSAEDVGPMVVWLAGSGVGYVTGQIMSLDGGLTQHL